MRTETLDAAAEALAAMTAPPPAADEKSITLSQYAQLWYAGMEGSINAGLNEPLSPFQQSLWVYKCIMALARTCSGIPLRLSVAGEGAKYNAKSFRASIRRSGLRTLRPVRGCKGVCVGRAAEGEIVEAGDAYELLERPNSYQDWPKLLTAMVGYMLARGKVAWVMTGMAGRGRRAAEIHCIDGKHITPQWAKDAASGMPVLLGYIYKPPKTGGEVALTTDEVKYWSLWDDSDDPLGGMSPLTPGRLAIATDYNASLYNAYSLVNGIEPGLKIKFPQSLTDPQREQFRQSLAMRNRGACRAKRELILEAGADAETLGEVLKDQGWNEGKRTTRLEICALFDVPPVVAGWVDAAGDSSAYTQNALRQFYMQAIFPMLDGLLPAIQEIVSRFETRLVAWFDVEDQPVVQEMRLSRMEAATKLFAMARPWADIDAMLDLGLPARPWDEVGWVPMGLVPASEQMSGGAALPAEDEGGAEGADEIGQSSGEGSAKSAIRNPQFTIDKDSADRLWRSWERSWAPLAKIAARMYANHFGAQQRVLLKLLRKYLVEANRAANSGPAVKSEAIIARILVEVFEDKDARLKFRARVQRVVNDSAELGLRQALSEAGLAGQALDEAAGRLMGDPRIVETLKSETVRISTRIDAFTRNHIRDSLLEGVQNGETVGKLADRVQDFMGGRRTASLSVARNTVSQTLSTSRHEGAAAAGMTHKGWIHSRGPGERRPAHIAAEQAYRSSPIPIAEPFVVNGYSLAYPRDYSSGAVGECVNCQCVALYSRGSRRSVTELLVRGFYGYDQMTAARTAAGNTQAAGDGQDGDDGQGDQT